MAEDRAKSDKSMLVGKKLGDYQLMEMLAAGGMARIYKGLDAKLQRRAAVKVLMSELMESDESMMERFQREARAVAQLEHDNIVTIYQYGEQDGLYFLAMRYIEGRDLSDELAELRRSGKEMEVPRALNILGQTAAALDHAHAAGIVHRDVKPSNILIDKQGKAYLTDFGLVLWSKDRTLGTAFGTPRYISPEQAIASEKSIPQSDIYSLAVILYEILTGSMLFRADTPLQIAISHISEPPPPPRSINPNIPFAVEKELLKALSKDPSERHQSASEFINAVRKAYAEAPPPFIPDGKTTIPLKDTDEMKVLAAEAKKAQSPTPATAPAPQPIKTTAPQAPIPQAPKIEAVKPAIESPKPKDEPQTPVSPASGWIQKNRPVMIGIAAAGLVAIFALISLLSGGGTPTPDENTEPTNAVEGQATQASVVNTGDGMPVLLIYDGETLVFRAENRTTLNVSGLEMARPGEESVFSGSDIAGQSVTEGKCVVILRGSQAFSPSQWGCGSVGESTRKALNPNQVFWREGGTATQFEVRFNGSVVGTCPVASRGTERVECRVNFPG